MGGQWGGGSSRDGCLVAREAMRLGIVERSWRSWITSVVVHNTLGGYIPEYTSPLVFFPPPGDVHYPILAAVKLLEAAGWPHLYPR